MATFESRGCMPRSAPLHVKVPRSPQAAPQGEDPPRKAATGIAHGFSRTAERAAQRASRSRSPGHAPGFPLEAPRVHDALLTTVSSSAGLTDSRGGSRSSSLSGAAAAACDEPAADAVGAGSYRGTPLGAGADQPIMSLEDLALHPCAGTLPPLPTAIDAPAAVPVTVYYNAPGTEWEQQGPVCTGDDASQADPEGSEAASASASASAGAHAQEMREAVETLEALREANNELHCTLEEATKAIAILRAENEAERARGGQLQAQMAGMAEELARAQSGSVHLREIAELRVQLEEERDVVRQKALEIERLEAAAAAKHAEVQHEPPPPPPAAEILDGFNAEEEALLAAADRQLDLCHDLIAF
eukprot:TRINITY_DN5498_c0_g1_i1.p1 TRINITY_DN5498_c0_g1~~TRINITY_DN5498_c0_g1_i1.p1  ORF type:complete len:360 (+),score=132.29 TRINITY_DN5498_c0_g1_i1:54-1133(+)